MIIISFEGIPRLNCLYDNRGTSSNSGVFIIVNLQRTDAWPCYFLNLLKHIALLHTGQYDLTEALVSQEFLDHFVDVHRLELAGGVSEVDSPIVSVKRLQHRIDVFCLLADEAEVDDPKEANILVLLVLNQLKNDLLLRLNLEHFEHEAEELGRASIATIRSTYVLELHRFVK